MSGEIERIEEQLRLSFEGGAWHGPSVLESLDGVSHQEAAAHPIEKAHSIWELALHLGGTYRLVLRRLMGDGRQMTAEEDWPVPPPPSAGAWTEALSNLRGLNREVRGAIRGFSEARLDRPLVPEPPYTAYVQFIVITQHDLYHAGQIVLLRKAIQGGGAG